MNQQSYLGQTASPGIALGLLHRTDRPHTVKANVYIGGNLCTQGGVQMTPAVNHTLAVYVKGFVNASGGGTIDTLPVGIKSGQPYADLTGD